MYNIKIIKLQNVYNRCHKIQQRGHYGYYNVDRILITIILINVTYHLCV